MVVVLVDDHAFEAISAYGTYLKDFSKTPTIDRLAKEGMRFRSLHLRQFHLLPQSSLNPHRTI